MSTCNDRVEPYVCVYEPPTPSRIQNVTHLRWKGLLCPKFVQEVSDTIMYVNYFFSSSLDLT